jgi:hypothetical protein
VRLTPNGSDTLQQRLQLSGNGRCYPQDWIACNRCTAGNPTTIAGSLCAAIPLHHVLKCGPSRFHCITLLRRCAAPYRGILNAPQDERIMRRKAAPCAAINPKLQMHAKPGLAIPGGYTATTTLVHVVRRHAAHTA